MTCNECHIDKPSTDFYFDRRRRKIFMKCKKCTNRRSHDRYKNNPELRDKHKYLHKTKYNAEGVVQNKRLIEFLNSLYELELPIYFTYPKIIT